MKKITLILIFISSICLGQTYTIDNNFNSSDTGTYSQIVGGYGVILNNGKILTTKGVGWGYTDIFRLNNDGSKDTSFTELNIPYSIDRFFANSIQGNFITARGTTSSDNTTLQCYDSNGLVVSSFSSPVFTNAVPHVPNTYSGSNINKIYFLNDGKFLIFGDFNFVNNVSYNGIVKLNANGSIDTGFNIGTGFSGSTSAFAIQANGKYLVGGDFTSYNGVSKGKMVRLETNGALDATFNVYTQYNSSGASYGYGSGKIQDIIIQPDGKIITSGPDLYSNGGRFRNDIVRLNSNGSVDTSFRFYENLTDLSVSKLLYNSDSTIFFEMGGRMKKCTNSGVLISAFNDTNQGGGTNNTSECVFAQLNNKIVVASNYRSSFGITRLGYHRLNSDGTLDLTFNPHFGPNSLFYGGQTNTTNDGIYHNILPDNKILLYGTFTSYNDIPVNYDPFRNMIRLSENGEIDSDFNVDTTIFNGLSMSDISIQTKKNYDGKLYIKGAFSDGFSTVYRILKLNHDGSLDANLNLNPVVVYDFKILDDNKIIATASLNGNKKIIRFNPDGSLDNTFTSPTFNYLPVSFEMLDDNKILVSFGSETFNFNHLIRLNANGTYDNTFISLPYNDFNVLGISKTKVINDKIYVFGRGTTSYPQNGNGFLMRYNSDWTVDNTYTPVETNSSLFLSNERTLNEKDETTDGIGMFSINDSNGNQLSTFSSGVSSLIRYSSQNCENIIFCGPLYEVNTTIRHNIFRLTIPGLTITPTPTGEINQLFTQGQTLADLIVNGQNIQWYTSQSECAFNALNRNSTELNSFLPVDTVLINGTTYYASQTINGVESNHRLPVTVNASLGVNNFEFNNYFSLYPNPTRDVLNITIKESIEISSINIYNALSQLVMEIPTAKETNMIDVSSLLSGYYFIKINSDKGSSNTKFIKN